MNKILILNNAERFVKWVNETFPKSAGDDRNDVQYAAWAICLREAHAIFDSYSTKDIASLFMEGIVPCNSMEAIQGWLDSFYDELNLNLRDGHIKLDADFCITAEEAELYDTDDLAMLVRQDYAPNSMKVNDQDED